MNGDEAPDEPRLKFKPTEFERLNPAASAEPVPEVTPGGDSPPRDVHAMLRLNAERDQRSGWYDARAGRDRKRARRLGGYLAALVIVDVPLGWIAWECGHADPLPFVAALAGLGLFTGRLTWETWFLRTD